MTAGATRPCPICTRPAVDDVRPFCSRRCRDVDLQRWFSGTYAIPGEDLDEDAVGEAGHGLRPPL